MCLYCLKRYALLLLLFWPLTLIFAQENTLPAAIQQLLQQKTMAEEQYQEMVTYLDTAAVSPRRRSAWIWNIISHFDQHGPSEYQARSRQLQGSYFIDEGDYVAASRCLFEGLRIAEKHRHTFVEGLCHNGLAIIHYQRYRHAQANKHWKLAIAKMREAGRNDRIAGILSNLGANFFGQNQLDSARFYHQLAFEQAAKLRQTSTEAAALNNLGNVYFKQNNFTQARAMYEQAMILEKELGNPISVVRILNNIGNIYEDEGQSQKALNLYQQALPLANETGDFMVQWLTYQNLANVYADLGRYREAYNFQSKYVILRDSSLKVEQESLINDLQTQYETEKKEQEIALLTRDAELNDARLNRQRLLLLGAALLVLLLGTLAWSIARGRQQLQQLLLNILPAPIIEELREKGKIRARRHESVSVLFADFVNFTHLSERISPEQLVELINEYFSAFDEIVGRYGVEKIKTIGDAYMCAAGLTTQDAEHTQHLVQAAQEMVLFAQRYHQAKGERSFQLRVGIHTGPVVAGVVGKKKFAYDIWGDTVNTAARMEQNSSANEITLSGYAYNLVKDLFPFEAKGILNIKGKGEMALYGWKF